MRRRTGWVMAVALAAVALAAVACSSDDAGSDTPAGAQRLTVTMGDALAFEPAALSVQAGKPVVLTVRNTGNTDHDFTIVEMPARDVKNATPGKQGMDHGAGMAISGHPKVKSEVSVRFTPTTAGVYEYECTLPGHRDQGMRGTITVT